MAWNMKPLFALGLLFFFVVLIFGMIMVTSPLMEGIGTKTAESMGTDNTAVYNTSASALNSSVSTASSNQGILVPIGILVMIVSVFGLSSVFSKIMTA